ncbi:hypothetical protein ACIGDI_34425 [Streptomyces sp. NPDC085900]|uniref:hypothetical protein n=1 Tax=Streptomyces sp. NPDC085900 TaxID=3365737 RepID=UPI0037D68AE3
MYWNARKTGDASNGRCRAVDVARVSGSACFIKRGVHSEERVCERAAALGPPVAEIST